jgi:hypothetical protein
LYKSTSGCGVQLVMVLGSAVKGGGDRRMSLCVSDEKSLGDW